MENPKAAINQNQLCHHNKPTALPVRRRREGRKEDDAETQQDLHDSADADRAVCCCQPVDRTRAALVRDWRVLVDADSEVHRGHPRKVIDSARERGIQGS